jgi:GNAT superfamily N-acetyltransferase
VDIMRDDTRDARDTDANDNDTQATQTICVESTIAESPRTIQIEGLFDLRHEATQKIRWDIALPLAERPWQIGLLTGPSGCGKSTIARHLWPSASQRLQRHEWPREEAIVDGFPASLSIKEIVALLSSVGFSSPPAWLRPHRVLSTGQQFRADLAWLIADALAWRETNPQPLVVFDEFTSTVDRTVAKIGSAALAKAVRQQPGQRLRFVAVTCHEDVIDWLQPDWTYNPATGEFNWRCLRRRPDIQLQIQRCPKEKWKLFAPHHYLTDKMHPAAQCFLATWHGTPVAFTSWLFFFGNATVPTQREHRTVTLPDYQGVGIGHAVSTLIASAYAAVGKRATCTTTHPAFIASRRRDPRWLMVRSPKLAGGGDVIAHAEARLTAGFHYIGPPLPKKQAEALLCRPTNAASR